ncbi:DUF6082 family protein [Streptomonospora halophila]|uniref:DUF6082 family protein n=1 Tax=Streptomonospora halophila TaxID=427369 RepID=UPI0031EF7E75
MVPSSASERGNTRPLTVATVLLLVVVALVLVGFSPLGLRAFGGADGEWERLSLIGQTYGAVSALISVLALVGVAVTLVFQARETRHSVEESRRQAMGELLQMAMDDPDLDECWGPVPADEDPKARKQQLYTNMIVTQWGTAFRAGAMPERRLRANAAEMFRGPVGRAYWAAARESRLRTTGRRLDRRFNEILDEEYQKAGPAEPAQLGDDREGGVPPEGAERTRSGAGRLLLAFASGAAVAGAAAGIVRHLRRNAARSQGAAGTTQVPAGPEGPPSGPRRGRFSAWPYRRPSWRARRSNRWRTAGSGRTWPPTTRT